MGVSHCIMFAVWMIMTYWKHIKTTAIKRAEINDNCVKKNNGHLIIYIYTTVKVHNEWEKLIGYFLVYLLYLIYYLNFNKIDIFPKLYETWKYQLW